MIRVVIEVLDGASRSSVVARAKSLNEAAGMATAIYPNAEVRVRFPIDAEDFFVKDPTARAGIVGFARLDEIAA